MATPEWQRHLPTEDIVLDTTLEEIPEGPPCMVCGFRTEKVFLEYTCGIDVIVRAKKTAGYRCSNDCDFECFSHDALFEALTKAREVMLRRGDKATAKAFEKAAELEKEIIEEDRFAMPR